MTVTITHTFVSTIPDDPAAVVAGEVVPSNWNAIHNITGLGTFATFNYDVPPPIGGTTPNTGQFKQLIAGYIGNAPALYIHNNMAAHYPSNFGTYEGAVGVNFTGGSNEVDFFNTTSGFVGGFNFYQQTAASAATKLVQFTTSGQNTDLPIGIGLGTTAPAVDLEINYGATSSKNFGGFTPSVVQIYKGSSGTPATDAVPMLGLSRYEAMTTDTEGAQNSPLMSMVTSYNDSSGGFSPTTTKYGLGAQSNGSLFIARQFGSGDAVGTWAQAEQNASHAFRLFFTVPQMANGQKYEIAFVGTTDFTLYGAASNTVGTVFTASGLPGTGTGTVYIAPFAATALVAGLRAKILIVGSTDFTLIGSPNNTVGTEFLTTGVGTGTGTVVQLLAYTAYPTFFNAEASAGSLAGLVPVETNAANNTGFDHTWAGTNAAQVFANGGYFSFAVDAVSNGTNRVAAGYNIRTSGAKFDVGLGASVGSIVTAFLQDDSSSITVLKVTGTHTTGIDMSGATISGSLIKGPGTTFSVAGTGSTVISGNATTLPAPTLGLFQMGAADSTQNQLNMDAFGAANVFVFRRADGTNASPTGVVANDVLGQFGWRGYTSSGAYVTGNKAIIAGISTESWSSTANGTQIDFYTTPNGSTTITKAMSLLNSGGLGIGTTSDPGIGLIYQNSASFLMRTKTSWNNGTGASAGTLTNAPAVGNPTKWIPVDDNGTTRFIPAW